MVLPQGRSNPRSGFAMIEVLISILILAIVAGAIYQGFAASSAQIGRSRLDTVASKIAAGELERLQRMSYEDIGVVAGNPPGTIAASVDRVVNGTTYRIVTGVVYVDDAGQGASKTYVNYKKITVDVTPQVPAGGQTVTASTLIAPPDFSTISGKATAVVTVVDSVTLLPLQGASVTVNGSTSPSRVDTTDANGRAVFAGLLPSATSSSSPQYYYVASATLGGYQTHPSFGTTVTRQNLAASQVWNVTIQMYKPGTLNVRLRDAATNNILTEYASVKVTNPPPLSTAETFTTWNGSLAVTTIGGQALVPSSTNFTVDATVECYGTVTKAVQVAPGYPTNTVATVDIAMTREVSGWLDVWVKSNNAAKTPLSGASVVVSGGPQNVNRTRTTDAGGYARFCVPSGTTPYTVAATISGYYSGSLPATVAVNATTPVTLALNAGSSLATLKLKTATPNKLVRIVAVSGSYDVQYTSNGSSTLDVSVAPGQYTVYVENGFSNGLPIWSAGKLITAPNSPRTAVP